MGSPSRGSGGWTEPLCLGAKFSLPFLQGGGKCQWSGGIWLKSCLRAVLAGCMWRRKVRTGGHLSLHPTLTPWSFGLILWSPSQELLSAHCHHVLPGAWPSWGAWDPGHVARSLADPAASRRSVRLMEVFNSLREGLGRGWLKYGCRGPGQHQSLLFPSPLTCSRICSL